MTREYFPAAPLSIVWTLLMLTLLAPPAQAEERCTKFGKKPMMYALGSSTLGMSLAPVITRPLRKRGFRWRKWAKASSGLARPDFWNWATRVPAVAKEWKPDVFLIVLGTNDFQSLRKDGKWVHPGKRWDRVYGQRVDTLLAAASGKKRRRMVIWVGPNMIDTKRARYMAKRITRIVKARIKAFDGPAFFVDAYRPTNIRGQPRRSLRVGKRKTVRMYEADGIHLTRAAARVVLARPVLRILDKCSKKKTAAKR